LSSLKTGKHVSSSYSKSKESIREQIYQESVNLSKMRYTTLKGIKQNTVIERE
jgi:hypothetical protein